VGKIIWLTGLPCSGKTTLGKKLVELTDSRLLDGDEIRALKKNNDFSMQGRKKHMLEVGEFAFEISSERDVIVSLVSPIREVREHIKEKYGNVFEVFVKCSLEECIRRDVKGMYAKAQKGEIKNFTGIDDPYEEPLENMIVVDTDKDSINDCVGKIMQKAGLNKEQENKLV